MANWLDPFLKAAGISQEALGEKLGLSRATVNRLANDHGKLKRARAEKIAPHLEVTAEQLMLNLPPVSGKGDTHYAPNPEDEPTPEFDVDAEEGSAALLQGQVQFDGKLPGSAPEMRSAPGLGPGQVLDSGDARIVSNGIATGHPVVGEWVLPPTYVRHGLGAAPGTIIVLPVIGHSMEPRLDSGDRVIVDVSQNAWIGDAIYVIDDGDTVFQAKTIKKVTSSHPPRYRIVSEASPADEVVRDATEFRFIGRVVGRVSRM